MENQLLNQLEILACPVTKESLTIEGTHLVSSYGKYPIESDTGIVDFIPRALNILKDPQWETWNHLQDNGVSSYTNEPERNLGVGARTDYISFAKFCELAGSVLDIGVGPQTIPTHFQYTDNKNLDLWGVDPLRGEKSREFSFHLALGEYLPFKDNAFDKTLFVTSLDHFIDPTMPLIEAGRVTKPKGEICIWIGEKSKDAPKPKTSPEWYQKLNIPKGAEDPFHFKRFSIDEFFSFVNIAGLRIKEKHEIKVDEWRKNMFFKLQK